MAQRSIFLVAFMEKSMEVNCCLNTKAFLSCLLILRRSHRRMRLHRSSADMRGRKRRGKRVQGCRSRLMAWNIARHRQVPRARQRTPTSSLSQENSLWLRLRNHRRPSSKLNQRRQRQEQQLSLSIAVKTYSANKCYF